MERYLNTPIKEIITAFPKIGQILEKYGIGCVPCSVGSCLLKDIMEIHNLSEKDERELLAKVADVIYPGREIVIPKIERKRRTVQAGLKYSPPIKKLVDEHVLIKRLIALVPEVIKNLDIDSEESRENVKRCVDFIRFYADKYHHAKEEDILFTYFDEGLDILKVIRQDHRAARGHVQEIIAGLQTHDKEKITSNLMSYSELLAEHIKKEDEILYPWIDRNLSVSQVGELFSKFNDEDKKTDSKIIEACKEFVEKLERKYKP